MKNKRLSDAGNVCYQSFAAFAIWIVGGVSCTARLKDACTFLPGVFNTRKAPAESRLAGGRGFVVYEKKGAVCVAKGILCGKKDALYERKGIVRGKKGGVCERKGGVYGRKGVTCGANYALFLANYALFLANYPAFQANCPAFATVHAKKILVYSPVFRV